MLLARFAAMTRRPGLGAVGVESRRKYRLNTMATNATAPKAAAMTGKCEVSECIVAE